MSIHLNHVTVIDITEHFVYKGILYRIKIRKSQLIDFAPFRLSKTVLCYTILALRNISLNTDIFKNDWYALS